VLHYLAARFVAEGGSVKSLVRQIVLSRTYRCASGCPGDSASVKRLIERDPENRLFGRANRRRADAEYLRDAVLSVAGRLDLAVGGPTFPADLATDYGYATPSHRRSVYVPAFRNAPLEIFEVFDAADPSVTTGARPISTSPKQALYLLNDPFLREQARGAAGRLRADIPADAAPTALVEGLFRRILGRAPADGELRIALEYLSAAGQTDEIVAWADLAHSLWASADFRYID
jgi:hypothetical protein